MRRIWMVLGAVALLAGGLALQGAAGTGESCDSDGVPDYADNCVCTPNGPELSTGACDTQLDADHDGYGNPCDTDVNNDGATGGDDVLATLAAASTLSTNPVFDFNCDGATGGDDVLRALSDAAQLVVPGPSGFACAGTIPCP